MIFLKQMYVIEKFTGIAFQKELSRENKNLLGDRWQNAGANLRPVSLVRALRLVTRRSPHIPTSNFPYKLSPPQYFRRVKVFVTYSCIGKQSVELYLTNKSSLA